MWTTKLLGPILTIVLCIFASCDAHREIVLLCEFSTTFPYTCTLRNVTVLNPNDHVVIKGEHVTGKNDLNVQRVSIQNSNTPFIIQQIFAQFPICNYLRIQNSHLHSIHFSPKTQLRFLIFSGNQVTRIDRNSFQGQSQLEHINLADSNVAEIAPNAFDGLHTLTHISFIRNAVRELPRRLFATQTNIDQIDLRSNRLSSIHEDDFAHNVNMQILRLGSNEINEIHPNAFANLRSRLSYIDLVQNRCVNSEFRLNDDNDWTHMYNALQKCFQNYMDAHPTPPPENVRNITIQFRGSLKLFDESGKLIIEV